MAIGHLHTEDTKRQMSIDKMGALNPMYGKVSPHYKDLQGKIYGELTVLRKNGKNKSQQTLWLCICSCGKECIVITGNLGSGNSKSCGHTRIEKNTGQKRQSMMRENHPLWIKDRTQVKQYWTERNNPEYKQWRKKVLLRDFFKCKMENLDCSGKIVAHHILGFTEYPELRYIINNGIALCHYHHPRKRVEEKKLSSYFQNLIKSNIN